MDKPITLVMEETKLSIINIINDSKLPIYIIEPIIKGLYNEISQLSLQFSLSEKEKYKKSIEKNEKNKNNEKSIL